jgi:pantoate--beta-alanine ligase
MIELPTIAQMRAWSRARRRAGGRIGCVPTMGYLHEGHLRLVDRARAGAGAGADGVVLSIFVNPLQFGPQEDLARYPRDLARDRRLAAARGVDCLFVPGADEMYPVPVAVTVAPGRLAEHLCGPHRPGHFAGVLTVVAKLFHVVEPDVAVFGRKDAQQAQIIRRMVMDLNFPIEIDVAPTVREADGLALSSRNVYLSPEERRAAAAIPRALAAGHAAYVAGARRTDQILAAIARTLAAVPALAPEYVEAVDPDTLAPVATTDASTLVALAVRAGATRLIDNVVLGQGLAVDPVLDG